MGETDDRGACELRRLVLGSEFTEKVDEDHNVMIAGGGFVMQAVTRLQSWRPETQHKKSISRISNDTGDVWKVERDRDTESHRCGAGRRKRNSSAWPYLVSCKTFQSNASPLVKRTQQDADVTARIRQTIDMHELKTCDEEAQKAKVQGLPMIPPMRECAQHRLDPLKEARKRNTCSEMTKPNTIHW